MGVKDLLEAAVQAAEAGGRILIRGFGTLSPQDAVAKSPTDIVTRWDTASEEEIVSRLKNAFPDHGFLAEEAGASGSGRFLWIIDPLDGTKNFFRGLPVFAVSVALAVDREIVLGVVHDPVNRVNYTAIKGMGAFANGESIRVSGRQHLHGAFLSTGFPHRRKQDMEAFLRSFKFFFNESLSVRRLGAAAIDLAHVASGIYDGFWEFGLYPWDVAAGYILVKEAGGVMTDFHGKQNFLEPCSVLAGTPAVHGEMLKVLQDIVG